MESEGKGEGALMIEDGSERRRAGEGEGEGEGSVC